MPFEVTDPIADSRGLAFWQERVGEAVASGTDATALTALLPIPLLDHHVADLQAAHSVFESDPYDAGNRARQECLVTRLNIAEQRLGWYSPVVRRAWERPLWKHWHVIRNAYFDDEFRLAKRLCRELNDPELGPQKN